MRPIAVDLFAGVGGMSLGLEQAGFDVACAVEYDPIHAAAHLYNFPDCRMIVNSVAAVTGADIRAKGGVGDRKVTVVVGGPPCQGFSTMGHRSIDDPRNSLVLDFVRIVGELDSDYFVFENVRGITIGEYARILREVIEEFGRIGYETVQHRVLNAKDYGVPQSRERLILLGHKRGLCAPAYPAPTHAADAYVTCREALSDLPDAEIFEELRSGDAVRHAVVRPSGTYAREMRAIDEGHWHLGYPRVWDEDVLTSSTRTDHGDVSRERFAACQPGRKEKVSRFFKLGPDAISNTLRAGTDAKRGAFTSPRPIHYDHARCITVREMARLSSFPDWFRFNVTKWHGARQIGNAVPPPLARAVGRSVIEAAGFDAIERGRPLALGCTSLLKLSASKARAMFGADNLIGRRWRKDERPAAPIETVGGSEAGDVGGFESADRIAA